ncbi:MAG TPA: hypothetical protein VNG71_11600 [Pyrinomonadaceae bacterium]|nr:hypothetical protein [Pyrinomonadaceae bacterium]
MATGNKTKALDQLVSELREAQGDNLASIVLYGATATAEDDHRSDHNVLVVLRSGAFEDLRGCSQALRAWRDAGQPPPVIFTTDELERAADVFPIEFLQMEQARKILHGSDPFASLTISSDNLRHQTEYDLRIRFIQLRRLYIARSPTGKDLVNLMIDSFGSFAALFRAVLILNGQEPAVTKAEAVRATANLLQLDVEPFDWILKMKGAKGAAPASVEVERVFAAYLKEIERVIDAVDRLA